MTLQSGVSHCPAPQLILGDVTYDLSVLLGQPQVCIRTGINGALSNRHSARFFSPDGYVVVNYGGSRAAIVHPLEKVLQAGREIGVDVIHTGEGYSADGSDVNAVKPALGYGGRPGPNGPFLIRGTPGHNFLEGFGPKGGEHVIDKPGFSAFYRTELDKILEDGAITHLIVTGVTTQCCVHSTLRDAVDRGYFIYRLKIVVWRLTRRFMMQQCKLSKQNSTCSDGYQARAILAD